MVVSSGGEQVYATLLLNDSYLPGALVLGHSLRDAGTTKKLAVLVTLDSVTPESVSRLKEVYDYVIPVPRIRNEKPANLFLMNRADLHSAFTKIGLWKQTQFSRIVYIDADVVAYRAPDELFSLPHAFAAAPDIGWPDIFNTGVMVLSPNMGDYHALNGMAERGISFDGADQGLLNMHFGNSFHRLPFTYNVTPSAHYQYLPAYRHFQSSINMVHFIGTNKPWRIGRQASHGSSAYDEMVGRWWAVYDRHYREQELSDLSSGSKIWDAQRQSQPTGSQPEARNFPSAHYETSRDATQFVSFEQYSAPVPQIFPWEGHQPKPSRSFVGYGYEPQPVVEAPVEPPATKTAPSPVELPSLASSTTSTKSEVVTPTTPTHTGHTAPWTSFSRANAWDDVPEINRYVEGFEKRQRSRSRSLKGARANPNAEESPEDDVEDDAEDDAENRVQLRGFKVTDFPSEVERPSLPVTPAPIRRPSAWGQGDGTEASDGRPPLPAAEGVPAQVEWDPTAQLQKLAEQQSEGLLRRLGRGIAGSWGFMTRETPSRPQSSGSEPVSPPTQVLSPQPVKGVAAVTTTALERKMESESREDIETADKKTASIQQPSYSGPGVAWDKDDMEIPQHETPLLPSEEERDVLDT